MNPYGSFNPANYSATNPFGIDTGRGWEFIRIINNSPYLLQISYGNMGSENFPEMFLEDKQITQSYNGKLEIVPVANFPMASIANALSSLVSINAYLPGEIRQPQAQPLTTLANVGNSVPLSATATSVANDGNAAGTVFVEATPSGAGSSQVSIKNDGTTLLLNSVTIGGGSGKNLILKQTAAGGGGPNTNILPDNPAGVASIYALFGWDGSNYNRCLTINSDGSITGNLGTSYAGFSHFSGTVSGIYNHGYGGIPSWFGPMQSVVGSQTMGFDSATSTQVHITSGSSNTFSCLCCKI